MIQLTSCENIDVGEVWKRSLLGKFGELYAASLPCSCDHFDDDMSSNSVIDMTSTTVPS